MEISLGVKNRLFTTLKNNSAGLSLGINNAKKKRVK
jgi:hypothetical protein